MRLVLSYKYSKYIDLNDKVNAIATLSMFDFVHIVLEGVVAHPEILANMSIGEGELVLQKPCENPVVIDKDNVVCNAEGFSHTEFGVALKKSVGGYTMSSRKFLWRCEDVKYLSVPGAFIAACFDGKYTNVVLTSYNGLFYEEAVYRRKPTNVSLGYKLATVTFNDGRSIIIAYPNRIIEVGMPTEAICLTPRDEFLVLSKNIIVEVGHEELRPLVLVNSKPIFKGFFYTLPVFQLGNALYVLDGGSLVKKIDVKGNATAWNIVVDDAFTDLFIYSPSLKLDLITRKELNTRCWATSEGVVCCRNSWCGLIENGETVIELEPLNEVHGFIVRSDSYVKVHSDLGKYTVNDVVKIVDEKASLLKPRSYVLSIEHLLGFTEAIFESSAKSIKVDVGEIVVYNSSGIHECGGFAYGIANVKVIEKPSRVIIKIGDSVVKDAGIVEFCTNNTELIPVIALDTVTNDVLQLFETKPEVRYIPTPKIDVKLRHFEKYSEVEIVKDNDVEVVKAKLCCNDVCNDMPKRIENCELPAFIELKVKKKGFIYSYRFDIVIPDLLDKVLGTIKGFKTRVVRVGRGGFTAYGVIPKQPAIPPIQSMQVYIAPKNITLEFVSRSVGRGLIVLSNGFIEGFILREGMNLIEVPFSDKMYIVLQTNLKWIYSLEFKPGQLLLVAKIQAEAVAKILKKLLGGQDS